MKKRIVFSARQVLLAALLVGPDARADTPPPEAFDCTWKSEGAACTYVGAGVCTRSTCARSDYLRWDRDASASPPVTTYDCLKCVTGTASNTSTATHTTTQTGTASNTSTTSTTATTTDTSTSTDNSGCSLGKSASATRVGAWLMAAAFSLLFLARRRRGQR